MAVAYPSDDDGHTLSTFMECFTQQESVRAIFQVSPQDVQVVRDACQSILNNLHRVSRLVLTSVPLSQDSDPPEVAGGLDGGVVPPAGSVYPHLLQYGASVRSAFVFSNTSEAVPPLLHHPQSFLESQVDAVDVMAGELVSAKDALLKLNATYAYVWTTEVEALRRYVALDEKRRRLQQPVWEQAGMRAVSVADDTEKSMLDTGRSDASSIAARKHGDDEEALAKDRCPAAAGSDDAAGSGMPTPPPTYRALLVLEASQLPSPQVCRCFMKFIQACESLLEWTDSVSGLLSGKDDVPKAGTYQVPAAQGPHAQPASDSVREGSEEKQPSQQSAPSRRTTTRRVRVVRYEIRDVRHIYDMFYQQAECFYLPEYAVYDRRAGLRLLQSSYYYALRMLIDDITVEIERLEKIASHREDLVRDDVRLSPYDAFQHGAFAPYPVVGGIGLFSTSPTPYRSSTGDPGEASTIVFRPPLPQFTFLRSSLRLLLSVSLNEDDRTSLAHFEEAYHALVRHTRDAVKELQHLPKPPPLSDAAQNSHAAPTEARLTDIQSAELVLATDERPVRGVLPPHQSVWVTSEDERRRLLEGFETYWVLRDKVHSLKSSLSKDISCKDGTHRTRVLDMCVAHERDPVATMAMERERERREMALRSRSEGKGWLGAARASLRALAGIATCQAEVHMEDLGLSIAPPLDDCGVVMTTTSPYHAEKTVLQDEVDRLWGAVEAHGARMEREYPGLFFRGERQRWGRRFNSLVKKANAVSLVFSP